MDSDSHIASAEKSLKNSTEDLLKKIDIGVKAAIRTEMNERRRNGEPIVVSRNGKIVWVDLNDEK
jgi:hypothetical protein